MPANQQCHRQPGTERRSQEQLGDAAPTGGRLRLRVGAVGPEVASQGESEQVCEGGEQQDGSRRCIGANAPASML